MSYNGFEYGQNGGSFGGGGGGEGTPGGGGGGYMTGGAVDSPAVGSGGQRNKDKQSILPVNVKQVLSSEMTSQDSGAKIDGVDVAQIKLVGCIVAVEDASTNTEYTIEDTTGRLKVKVFHNDGEGSNDRSAERRARNQEGTYVRVFGNVRSWKDDRHSVAHDMQPITDFNEVTMHILETIYTHLFNTKGPLPGKGTVSGGGAAVAPPMHGVGSPGLHGDGSMSQQGFVSPGNMNAGSGNLSAMHEKGDKFENSIYQKVHHMFMDAESENGRSTAEVIEVLRHEGISANQVIEAVDFLSSDGHLYSTIDDTHFRTTEH